MDSEKRILDLILNSQGKTKTQQVEKTIDEKQCHEYRKRQE